MNCGDPRCNGVHNTSRPVAELCPVAVERKRAYLRTWSRKRRETGGICGMKGCTEPRVRFKNGKFATRCRECRREYHRRYCRERYHRDVIFAMKQNLTRNRKRRAEATQRDLDRIRSLDAKTD